MLSIVFVVYPMVLPKSIWDRLQWEYIFRLTQREIKQKQYLVWNQAVTATEHHIRLWCLLLCWMGVKNRTKLLWCVCTGKKKNIWVSPSVNEQLNLLNCEGFTMPQKHTRVQIKTQRQQLWKWPEMERDQQNRKVRQQWPWRGRTSGLGWGRRKKRTVGEYAQTTLFTHTKSHNETYYSVGCIYANKISQCF